MWGQKGEGRESITRELGWKAVASEGDVGGAPCLPALSKLTGSHAVVLRLWRASVGCLHFGGGFSWLVLGKLGFLRGHSLAGIQAPKRVLRGCHGCPKAVCCLSVLERCDRCKRQDTNLFFLLVSLPASHLAPPVFFGHNKWLTVDLENPLSSKPSLPRMYCIATDGGQQTLSLLPRTLTPSCVHCFGSTEKPKLPDSNLNCQFNRKNCLSSFWNQAL